ncbi:MAG: ribbon-helix-helix domain-containing protein [Proteobacteria bacterium]|nr:ribbon-helix-helix domain-containing protein [Pseudomonadota bacterium]
MTYSVKLGDRWTTIRLEQELMSALHDIALGMGIGVHELCTEVALDRPDGSFTSALRVFVVNHYRRLSRTVSPSERTSLERMAAGRGDLSMSRRLIDVGARETAPELASFYTWWLEYQPASDRVPQHEAINPDLLRVLGLGGLVHVVDATATDPMNYRLRVFGRKVAVVGGRDFAGCRIRDVRGREYSAAAAEDYFTAVSTGVPRLQEVDASIGGFRRVYQRLIAPFSSDGHAPDTLLVAVCYKSPGLVDKLSPDLGA